MLKRFYDAIGYLLGDDKPNEDLEEMDFESGPFLDYGISWVYTFKKLILPKEFRTYGRTCPSRCANKLKCKT